MGSVLTILLWAGYLGLFALLALPGVSLGFFPVLGLALVWTVVIEGMRKLFKAG